MYTTAAAWSSGWAASALLVFLVLLQSRESVGSFAARPVVPIVAWSLSQTGCINASFPDQINGSLTLRRNISASTVCPSSVSDGLLWKNALIGSTSTNQLEENSLKTDAIGSVLNSIASDPGPAGNKSMSIEIWFSFNGTLVADETHVLFEIGGPGAGKNTAYVSLDSYQMKISYTQHQGANTGYIFVEYVFAYGPSPLLGSRVATFYALDVAPVLASIEQGDPRRIYMLILTIAGESNAHVMTLHVGQNTQTTMGSSTVTTVTFSPAPTIRYFVFPSVSVIRLGTTRGIQGNGIQGKGIRGTIHAAAMYDQALTQTQAGNILSNGLPNSVPVVKPASFVYVSV